MRKIKYEKSSHGATQAALESVKRLKRESVLPVGGFCREVGTYQYRQT
jgi:hypothetical protein